MNEGRAPLVPKVAQSWDAARYGQDCRFVADLGRPVLDGLNPQPGECILDLGCGDGALTEEIAARGARVIGCDADPQMVAAAQKRGLDVRLANGEALPFAGEFDAVFSNAALHWMKRGGAVLHGVARALKPGGRFVAEFGGAGNVERVRHALIAALNARGLNGSAADPWFFPTPDAYHALLEQAGFRVEALDLIPRPTPLAAGMSAWLAAFSGAFTALLPEGDRADYLAEVEQSLIPTLRHPDGNWWADYVRLRVRAVKARGAIVLPESSVSVPS